MGLDLGPIVYLIKRARNNRSCKTLQQKVRNRLRAVKTKKNNKTVTSELQSHVTPLPQKTRINYKKKSGSMKFRYCALV